MVSKNLPMGIKIVIPVKHWWFDGYLKLRESLYTQGINWVNTILHHIDIRTTLPRYEDNYMVYDPDWYWNIKNTIKYPHPTGIKEKWNPHYTYPNGIQKKMIWGQHWFEQRTLYICSLRVKLILGCQEVLIWVWPSTEQNRLLFIKLHTTSVHAPQMEKKYCMQNNQWKSQGTNSIQKVPLSWRVTQIVHSKLAYFGNSTYHHSQVPMHTRSRPKKLEYCQTGHKKAKKPQEKVLVRD